MTIHCECVRAINSLSLSEIIQLLTIEALDVIQLMHSFEVNIRICQLENSEAEVNITFEG